jgi:hypothetical protein
MVKSTCMIYTKNNKAQTSHYQVHQSKQQEEKVEYRG